ncbi:MAG: hypothetical protein JRJ54_10790 [Deltaproteobacteria bacterium]|nr:hypothetical protein [Deltaproteobacteria bacterium]
MTCYDVGLDITAGEVEDRARLRRAFHPSGKSEEGQAQDVNHTLKQGIEESPADFSEAP